MSSSEQTNIPPSTLLLHKDNMSSDRASAAAAKNKDGSSVIKGKEVAATRGPSLPRPKRPLSAYNLYFRDQREILLKNLPSIKQGRGHGKISFFDLAKVIGANWRVIDPQEKQEYEKVANRDREEYQRLLKEWKETQLKNGHSTKRQHKPKKQKAAAPSTVVSCNSLSTQGSRKTAPANRQFNQAMVFPQANTNHQRNLLGRPVPLVGNSLPTSDATYEALPGNNFAAPVQPNNMMGQTNRVDMLDTGPNMPTLQQQLLQQREVYHSSSFPIANWMTPPPPMGGNGMMAVPPKQEQVAMWQNHEAPSLAPNHSMLDDDLEPFPIEFDTTPIPHDIHPACSANYSTEPFW